MCHFIVKCLIAEPSVALIIYTEDKHVDKKGLPCHGPQDTKAARTRAMFAPYILEDLCLRVLSLLHVGVSMETIMQRHSESVVRQGGPSNRDDQLSHWYVRRQERSIRCSTYELDADDAISACGLQAIRIIFSFMKISLIQNLSLWAFKQSGSYSK